ncbi:MAG: CpsB/CapC family capsule biosynthesis tyrosine phosphatase [Chloroflexota bacterium]|nr:protein-tyrosine-phosphatase [Dehalococcoidia bacterium]MDW8252889.1 CpsB/CapC family capsule biosynthesis tyrosine phosphatase [Chloroflexota bacterium]
MRDLHCHILPCVDDGAESHEDALAMARLAVAEGIRDIVATPHHHMLDQRQPRDDVVRRVSALQAALAAEDIPLTIHPGCELYLTPDSPQQWDAGNLLPLAGTDFLLVETAFHEYPWYVEETIFQLQARGARIILAHPERYVAFQRDPSILRTLVARGVLAQITAGSLLGAFGKSAKAAAELFLQEGLAHLIATDAHRPSGSRSTAIVRARQRAAELVGEARAQAMTEDLPAAILRGELIDLPPVEPRASSWAFWKRWAVGARQ